MIRITTISAIVWACVLCPRGGCAEAAIEFNAYPYLSNVKSDADLTIDTAITLPARLSYFSFMNFGGLFHSGPPKFQISEQNLRWRVSDRFPIDLAVQTVIRNGSDNNTVHAGIRWRVDDTTGFNRFLEAMHLTYSVQLFLKRFDERDVGGWQISHSYQLAFPAVSDRLYFSGFLDHNINERAIMGVRRDSIISENQLGLRLFNEVYAVVEYRFNEYRPSNKSNVGVGVEFRLNW